MSSFSQNIAATMEIPFSDVAASWLCGVAAEHAFDA
jgi:hypothetical protein